VDWRFLLLVHCYCYYSLAFFFGFCNVASFASLQLWFVLPIVELHLGLVFGCTVFFYLCATPQSQHIFLGLVSQNGGMVYSWSLHCAWQLPTVVDWSRGCIGAAWTLGLEFPLLSCSWARVVERSRVVLNERVDHFACGIQCIDKPHIC
jgi:hypothetical protein